MNEVFAVTYVHAAAGRVRAGAVVLAKTVLLRVKAHRGLEAS